MSGKAGKQAGRPVSGEEKLSMRLEFLISKSMMDALEARRRETGVNVSEQARRAIQRDLDGITANRRHPVVSEMLSEAEAATNQRLKDDSAKGSSKPGKRAA